MTDVRYNSGNRFVAIGGEDCNRRHEKPKVVHSDKEQVQRVFRVVEVQDESLVKPGPCLNRMRILVRSDTLLHVVGE